MKLLFTFENPLPNRLADAEVFVQTAKALAERFAGASMLVPAARSEVSTEGALTIRRCRAPVRFALFRHLFMALSLPFRPELERCDAVYTRNLLVAAVAVLSGKRVIFDHYRPWGDQLPPLQPFLRWLMHHPRLVVCICHSRLTQRCYERIGVRSVKLATVHTGFDPAALQPEVSTTEARRGLGLAVERPIAMYTGRVNHKKGLDVLLAAAEIAKEIDFVLVGAEGGTATERAARSVANVKLVPFQPQRKLARYLHAADVLIIPPATAPLRFHGSTVLPLKTFLYLGAAKPIVAGATPDNLEVLAHGANALLVEPDEPRALAAAVRQVLGDPALGSRLSAGARATARSATWSGRAERIATLLDGQRDPAADGPPHAARPGWLRESGLWLQHVLRTGHWAAPCREPASVSRRSVRELGAANEEVHACQ
jgi:glycosyltransferase involved in cell wall biosynthesis